jgi:hypothetical protein
MSNDTPSATQIRAAMAMLKWENEELSEATGIGTTTAFNVKMGNNKPQPRIRAKIRKAFESQGIEFLDNDGVRKRPEGVEVMNGREGLCRLLDDVYAYASSNGGEIGITGFDLGQWAHILGDYVDVQVKRMTELFKQRSDIRVRTVIREGSIDLVGSEYSQYRWQPREEFEAVPFYVYGEYLAIISFQSDPSPKIIKLRSLPIASAYQLQFNSMWERAKEIPPVRKND